MFDGLTMVNFDGQTQNQMMVRPWSTMVDHGQPWSDGQTVAGGGGGGGVQKIKSDKFCQNYTTAIGYAFFFKRKLYLNSLLFL